MTTERPEEQRQGEAGVAKLTAQNQRQNLGALLQEFGQTRAALENELAKVVVGQKDAIRQIFAAIFTRGHCLLEGVPGLAKTLTVSTIAKILDVNFRSSRRILPLRISRALISLRRTRRGREVFVLLRGQSSRIFSLRTKSTEPRRRRNPRSFKRCRSVKLPSAERRTNSPILSS